MKNEQIEALRRVLPRFAIEGQLTAVEPFQRGHIHDTYLSTWSADGAAKRYIHQRINDKVFRDVPGLMHNIELVTRHLASGDAAEPGSATPHTLLLVPTRAGHAYAQTDSGPWRTYHFIERTQSYDLCRSAEQAFEAARAFGDFQARLTDLDVLELRETIPDFFSSPHRMQQLEDALESDPLDRAQEAAAEVRFALERKPMVRAIADRVRAGTIPERIVHGDTKLNNVLFDETTGKAVCIVDLDTIMPAYSLYDFGDLVRFTAATSGEDERDLERAGTDLELYRALVGGYLEGTGGMLTDEEVELMPFAARLVTLTIGLRFLTDHVAGDVYFKVARPGHNLDRARVQFRMVECMEQREREMNVTRGAVKASGTRPRSA